MSALSNATNSPLLGALNNFRDNENPNQTGKPKAYLNWILLDEQFRYVAASSGADVVKDANNIYALTSGGPVNIAKNGYLYIYVSNETQNWDVFFDNLAIQNITGPIIMKKINLFIILCYFLTNCHSQDSTDVRIRKNKNSLTNVKTIKRDKLTHQFGSFYEDAEGSFFIQSYGHKKSAAKEFEPQEVFVEIPKIDSSTYINYNSYFKDYLHVICVFENSDGGNYVQLKDADPISFVAFKSCFGGKDKNNVFYQQKLLPGLDPRKVKVYSRSTNCYNCECYFTDGKLSYYGSKKILNPNFTFPNEYRITE